MKKFLPKRKTERKPSDEEFVIRKSKCCDFLFFLEASLYSVMPTGPWYNGMPMLGASLCAAEHGRILEGSDRSPSSRGWQTCCHPSTGSWVGGCLVLGMKPRNDFQVDKSCCKTAHQ